MRKVENLFDIVYNLEAATLDSTQLESLCRRQQALTMKRTAYWLLGQSKLRKANGEISISSQFFNLSEELDYLSTLPQTLHSDMDKETWLS